MMNILIPHIKRWFRNLPIVRKFSLSIYITIATPALILIPLSLLISDRITIDRSTSQNLQYLDAVALSIDSLLKHTDNISRIIVRNEYIQKLCNLSEGANRQELIEREYRTRIELDNIIQTRDIVSSASLLLNDGLLVGSGYTDQNILEEHRGELASYEKLFGSKRTMTWVLDTHPVHYEETRQIEHCISFIRRVFSIDRAKITGLIVLNIHSRTISRLFADGEGARSRTFLVNEAGQIISAASSEALYHSIAGEPWFQKMNKGARSGEIYRTSNGRSLITLVPLAGKWQLIREVPLSEIFPARRKITLLLFLGLFLCLLPGVFMGQLFTRFFTHPLLDLSEAMTMAGMGDLEVRIPETSGDEIGQLAVTFNEMTSRISELMDELYLQQRARRRHELSALQAQIHPHFLYNTLDSVCGLIQLEEYEKAQGAVKAMGQFYRGALSAGRSLITVKEELRIVDSYMEIQMMRYREKFDYTQRVERSCLEHFIPKLCLQPLVENAIYHGLRGKSSGGTIQITGSLGDDFCTLTVIDNGKGFPFDFREKTVGRHDSYGISNIRERLALYNEKSELVIDSRPGMTRVSLRIPLKEGEDDKV